MKGLIVESSRTYQKLLASVIEQGGLDVVVANNGTEAFELLDSQDFDLVCVAMFLKDMDGISLTSELRHKPKYLHTPLIMVTSVEDPSAMVKASSVGVTELFSKKDLAKIAEYVAEFVLHQGVSETLQGHILYVEDSRSVALTTIMLLKEKGLTVDHFSSAEEAFTAYTECNYDLVLTDVVLEGMMSGIALVRALRGLGGVKARVPVLAMSGFDDNARKIELLRSGANDYVAKPALAEELVARLANLLTSKRLMDRIESQQARLHSLAMRDQLTGLYNRHYLMETVPAKLKESFRHQYPCSLIVIDADHFKQVNDNHGHQAGDIVLQELGGVISDSCRQEDVAARFGGEEFVIFLGHCDGPSAVKKADDLRGVIEGLRPAGLKVTVSVGVATSSVDQVCEFADLFKAADEAVYQAKSDGRNRVVQGVSDLSSPNGGNV